MSQRTKPSRRSLMLILGASSLCAPTLARAATTTYTYDELGRIKTATYASGAVVTFTYDAAGNRTQVSSTSSAFSATIQVTGSGPVNLYTLATGAGYSGLVDATVVFEVGSGVTIMGAAGSPGGGPGIDSGTWPTGSSDINVSLLVKTGGKVYGGGGAGGNGGGAQADATTGGTGGDAIYCRLPMIVTVQSGAEIKAAGGGGAGGGGWFDSFGTFSYGGGSGGGGFPNGPGGDSGADVSSGSGSNGTTSGGGAASSSTVVVPGPFGRATGAGGAGGGAAGTGSAATLGTGTANSQWWQYQNWNTGGPGYAIRKNSHPVTVINNGTIAGTQA